MSTSDGITEALALIARANRDRDARVDALAASLLAAWTRIERLERELGASPPTPKPPQKPTPRNGHTALAAAGATIAAGARWRR